MSFNQQPRGLRVLPRVGALAPEGEQDGALRGRAEEDVVGGERPEGVAGQHAQMVGGARGDEGGVRAGEVALGDAAGVLEQAGARLARALHRVEAAAARVAHGAREEAREGQALRALFAGAFTSCGGDACGSACSAACGVRRRRSGCHRTTRTAGARAAFIGR